MRNDKNKKGLTLTEIIVVVAIVGVLTSIMLTVHTRISNQGNEQLTKGTIAILTLALEEFRDYGYEYLDNTAYEVNESHFYRSLKFPVDCNGCDLTGSDGLEDTLRRVLVLSQPVVVREINDGTFEHLPEYSGGEVLYYFLSQVPQCRKTLKNINKSFITNADEKGRHMKIEISPYRVYPLYRVVDPWGKTLRYDYYDDTGAWSYRENSKRSFPLITSAGADGVFDTEDDITNL